MQVRSAGWVCALAALAMVGCLGKVDRAAVENATKKVHAQYNDGRYGELYQGADQGFRTISEKQFVGMMKGVHRRLGTYVSGSLLSWFNKVGTGAAYTEVYESTFSRGKATETFVWRMTSEGPRLFGYNVNSPLLVTDDVDEPADVVESGASHPTGKPSDSKVR